MFRYLILSLAFTVNGAPNLSRLQQLDGRIVGGTPTNIEEYPYQVSVQNSGFHICGGSIISPEFILTAAHCTFSTSFVYLSVRVGSNVTDKGGQVISVQEVHQNPLFSFDSMDYDISLIRLVERLTFKPSVAPISVVSSDYLIAPGTDFVVTGWGTLSENGFSSLNLQVVKIPYVNNEKCQQAYYDTVITERMICAGSTLGGKDSCQGDSGGPLVADGVLVGVVSWGYGCARPEFPGVYSRISQLRDYIKNVTQF